MTFFPVFAPSDVSFLRRGVAQIMVENTYMVEIVNIFSKNVANALRNDLVDEMNSLCGAVNCS